MGEKITERKTVGYLRKVRAGTRPVASSLSGFRGLVVSDELTANSPESFERSDLNPALLLNRISQVTYR